RCVRRAVRVRRERSSAPNAASRCEPRANARAAARTWRRERSSARNAATRWSSRMPAYSGKFQYLDESGGTVSQGPCQVNFDAERCIVTPASGTPLAFDLGDIDHAVPGEWDLQLVLYTGRTVQ